MIYITGDTHCPIDMKKLKNRNLPPGLQAKTDFLIICGDCGLVWEGGKEEQYWQRQIEQKKFTTLFVDGNHEDHARLAQYPEERWNGGKIHKIQPSILHLMRGQVFEIEGMKFFVMGGAASADKHLRKEGFDWFAQEIPSRQEREEAVRNLEKINWNVDYVLTHTAPTDVIGKIGRKDRTDEFTDFLQSIEERLRYRHWYFGHFHADQRADEKHTLLYQKIVPLTD